MNPPSSLTEHRLNVGSLRLDIFSQILLSIFTGEYQAGTRLKVQHLAKQYGVSSTPVREAIVELTGIGVVELIPNRGAVVAPFGIPEIREIYHVRRILEVEAVRCACDCPNLEEIELLLSDTRDLQQADRDSKWGVRCSDLDKRTHIAIANAAGNKRLKAELDRYDRLMHIIRVLVNDWDPFLDQIHNEHIEVLVAILKRDKDAAGEAMARHLTATCERAIEGVFVRGLAEE